MEILFMRALRGPNVWSQASVLEARIDVAEHAGLAKERVLAFERRLATWLPGYSAERAVPGHSGRLRIADGLRGVAVALHVLAGATGSSVAMVPRGSTNTPDIAFECQDERLARACLEAARRVCVAALASEDRFDVHFEVNRLRSLGEDVGLGHPAGPLAAVARARGIPFRHLDDGKLVLLGQGANQQRIRTAQSERARKDAIPFSACEAAVSSLFPGPANGRIPIAVVSGGGDRVRVGRLMAELLHLPGRRIGRSSSTGLFLGEKLTQAGDFACLDGSLLTLLCHEVDLAVLERDLLSIREEGLGIDRVDVAILTRPEKEAGVALDPEIERVVRVLAGAAVPNGTVVVEGDDRAGLAAVASFALTSIVVGRDEAPVRPGERGRGAVFLRDNILVFRARGGEEHPERMPASVLAQPPSSWLLAVGGAWAMGASAETIAERIRSLPSLVK